MSIKHEEKNHISPLYVLINMIEKNYWIIY